MKVQYHENQIFQLNRTQCCSHRVVAVSAALLQASPHNIVPWKVSPITDPSHHHHHHHHHPHCHRHQSNVNISSELNSFVSISKKRGLEAKEAQRIKCLREHGSLSSSPFNVIHYPHHHHHHHLHDHYHHHHHHRYHQNEPLIVFALGKLALRRRRAR